MSSVHAETVDQKLSAVPDDLGRFGRFGGRYVPETLQRSISWRRHMKKQLPTQSLSANSKDYLQPSLDVPPPCFSPGGLLRKRAVLRFTLSERISAIQGLTKSIIRWGRHCLRFAWASSESLLRLEQASTVLQLQRHVRDLDLNALSIWDQRTCVASPRTFER